MQEALEGKYVMPGPGGDPIRNPKVLPTGKNMHALDPQSIPTAAAVKGAKVVVDRLLEREYQVNGNVWPESIALVLWGTDNIKTYGESLAQARPCHTDILRTPRPVASTPILRLTRVSNFFRRFVCRAGCMQCNCRTMWCRSCCALPWCRSSRTFFGVAVD